MYACAHVTQVSFVVYGPCVCLFSFTDSTDSLRRKRHRAEHPSWAIIFVQEWIEQLQKRLQCNFLMFGSKYYSLISCRWVAFGEQLFRRLQVDIWTLGHYIDTPTSAILLPYMRDPRADYGIHILIDYPGVQPMTLKIGVVPTRPFRRDEILSLRVDSCLTWPPLFEFVGFWCHRPTACATMNSTVIMVTVAIVLWWG